RGFTGGIAVEAKNDLRRQPGQLSQLSFCQRRSHRRDDRLDACLAERDHVGVPLDDDRTFLLRDRRACEVEPVEEVPVTEELALRRVYILRTERVVLAQLPCLKSEHPAPRIAER